MQESPDQKWRQLTAHYADMWDNELLSLAADYNDLTDIARQVLRDEMRKRGLGDPAAPRAPAPTLAAAQASPAPPPLVFPLPPDPASPRTTGEPARPIGAREEREWQRCKEHYAGLGNEDLEDLVAEYDDLTPIAQQAFRDEMANRGLGDPEQKPRAVTEESDHTGEHDETNPLLVAAENRAQSVEINEWWIRVFETGDQKLAEQYSIMLTNAGILYRWRRGPFGGDVIDAAADQAEEAQRVLAQPIPQSVIEESKGEESEYEIPRCPRCRTEDPTLLGTEPSNQWLCESCGNQWSDPIAEPGQV